MYAIIEAGGKQFRVQEGNKIVVDRMAAEAGEEVTFDRVLMLGGAVGNMIDRFVTGYVVDMFEILLFRFAIFNVADVALTVGAILMGITLLWMPKEWSEKTHGDANDSAV